MKIRGDEYNDETNAYQATQWPDILKRSHALHSIIGLLIRIAQIRRRHCCQTIGHI